MTKKVLIKDLYNKIKEYYNLNDENFLENQVNMFYELNETTENGIVTCNNHYSAVFDSTALYIENYDDLICIPLKNGEKTLEYLEKIEVQYITIDEELPVIKDIFKKNKKKRVIKWPN